MKAALEDAKVAPGDVDYVNAHGTSTPHGDVEEARAIVNLFGEHALSGAPDKRLWVSSTKSVMGHLLGGAGGVEAAICALAIRDGVVPPTINLHKQSPEVPLDLVPHEARRRALRHTLSNSFGFGGTNASVMISRYEPSR